MPRRLSDPMSLRTWKYTATNADGKRLGEELINENLTGAVLGSQKPAYIAFRTALWLIHGWNQLGGLHYRLVLPNPRT